MKNKILGLFIIACVFCLPLEAQTPPANSNSEMVTVQFPNAQVTDILAFYEQLTGKHLIRDAVLAGANLTVIAPQPMPKSEAIRFIESALLLNGYSIIPAGDNAVKIVNAAGGKNPRSEGIPLYANAADLPPGDQIVSYFMPLRYVSPTDALPIFQGHIVLHSYGALVAVPNAQAILVTENASVVRQLVALRDLIDVPPAELTHEFVSLERADAERVVDIINKIIEARKNNAANRPGAAPGQAVAQPQPNQPANPGAVVANSNDSALFSTDVQLVADPRTNRILVITRPSNFANIRALIKEFDQAVGLSAPLERPLKYISAGDVLPVLKTILAENKDDAAAGANQPNTPNQRVNNNFNNNLNRNTSGSSSSSNLNLSLDAKTEDTVPESVSVGKTRLIADKKANSIIVIGPPESLDKVRVILDKLDAKPKQVYLATVIGQLNLKNNYELGIDILHKFTKFGDANGIASSSQNGAASKFVDPRSLVSSGAFPSAAGLTLYGAAGSVLDFYVKALESTDRFKIVSRPTIYAANNQVAVLSSGQQIAVPTSSIGTVVGSTGTGSTIAQNTTIDYKNIELELQVQPLINSEKEVTLKIVQQNNTVSGNTTIDGNTVPTIATQGLQTSVTVPNRGTVVLGGLITENRDKNTTGTPWLSRIPLLGYLFKDEKRDYNRTELIILIQPTVVDSDEELQAASQAEVDRNAIGHESAAQAVSPETSPNAYTPVAPDKKSPTSSKIRDAARSLDTSETTSP